MANPTKPVETKSVTLNGAKFDLEVAVSNRGEEKGVHFLKFNPKSFDSAALLRLFSSVGEEAARALAIKALNKAISDSTADAFVVARNDKGEVTSVTFDESKASKGILDAVAETTSTGKDELESKLAELRGKLEPLMDTILATMGKGQPVNPATINQVTQLRIQVVQLENKLTKKARKPKAPEAAPVTK